jgi:hypothetical protein
MPSAGARSPPCSAFEKLWPRSRKKVATKDPVPDATGAALLLENLSPALEQVDSSSRAIGTAVIHAIEACASITSKAPVDAETRARWLDWLWRP